MSYTAADIHISGFRCQATTYWGMQKGKEMNIYFRDQKQKMFPWEQKKCEILPP